MKRHLSMIMALLGLVHGAAAQSLSEPDWEAMPYTAHAELQAVDATGAGIHPLDQPLKLRGVIANRSEQMLNPAIGQATFLGGMWQVYVEAVDAGDFGGTACWMGQYYGNFPFNPPDESYADTEWLAELDRLTHDPASGHAFAVGDLVEIRARAPGLSHHGKVNVNEIHAKDPIFDFDIVLLEADRGLPTPPVITLAELKDSADQFIFDAARASGCERYQGALVRLRDVHLNVAAWQPDGEYTIADATGRTFSLKVGLGGGYDAYPPPAGDFEVVALLDQEDESDSGTMGYRLWVTRDYDGNGWMVGGPSGDFDASGSVDSADYAALADCLTGPNAVPVPVAAGVLACREAFDFDMDRDVDLSDFASFQRIYAGS